MVIDALKRNRNTNMLFPQLNIKHCYINKQKISSLLQTLANLLKIQFTSNDDSGIPKLTQWKEIKVQNNNLILLCR